MGIPTISCVNRRSSISRFSSIAAFWDYLDSLGLFHMDMGLGRMHAALGALGLGAASCVRVQVAGTNGKGSTSVMLSEMFQAAGVTTGLYASPHFLSPKERIAINGRPLPDTDWLAAAEAVLAHSEDKAPHLRLTYFELLTVMAAWLFREHRCRAAVFEAGLGGAHDATTALKHHLTVFTPIGLDHQHIIGPTLADIARDKSGAMTSDVPAITGFQPPEAAAVLAQAARERGVTLHQADVIIATHGSDWPATPTMAGPHQSGNLRLAMAAYGLLAERHGVPVTPAIMRQAAERAFVPGRMQFIPGVGSATLRAATPTLLLDAAHNEPGLIALRQTLDSLSLEPRAVIFACLKDKDLDAILPLVRVLTTGPILVPPIDAPGRAMDPVALAQAIGPAARPVDSMEQALSVVCELPGVVLLCGSIYLLAQAYQLYPEWLERKSAGAEPRLWPSGNARCLQR